VVNKFAGAEVQAVFRERHRLSPGDRLGLAPKVDHVHIFDKERGTRINP